MSEALAQVKSAAEEYDRTLIEARDAFYEAVREAAKTHTPTEIAGHSGRTVSRICQIIGRRPHSRRRVVELDKPPKERKKRVGVEIHVA